MTPDQQATVEVLRAVLPPIYEDCWAPNSREGGGTDMVCIDLEWDEDDGSLELVGIGNERWVSQFHWKTMTPQSQEMLRKRLLIEIGQRPVVIQNCDGDIRKLRANAFPILGPAQFFRLEDTMLAHAVLHSEEDHDLGYLVAQTGKLPDYKHLRKVAPKEYNATDLVGTVLAWKHLIAPQLAVDVQAEFIYRTQSLPFVWLAIEGEEAGIAVAQDGTPMRLYDKFDTKRRQARLLLQAYAGWPISISSPDQYKHFIYNIEEFPIQRGKSAEWGEEGSATADKEALAVLRRSVGTEWDEGEQPTLEQAYDNILAGGNVALEAKYLFTGAQQAVTHYVIPCLVTEGEKEKKRVVGVRTRIYPECRQHVQSSGRHSYVGPALQQMKDELLDLISPDPGHCWVGHDWKQIEVRILAYEANDVVYIEIFTRGGDIHEENVRAIFGAAKATKVVEGIRRGFIKRYVFRLHYRGKPENAGDIPGTKALGLDVPGLVAASERYLLAHPALPVYWRQIEDEAERTRCVRTFMGRPRRLTSPWPNARKREAANQPMQGGVADIYITTALKVKQAAPWARLVFGAHDAHWWQVPIERRLEFLWIYAPIVEREFVINGQVVSFPADYKFREAAGLSLGGRG